MAAVHIREKGMETLRNMSYLGIPVVGPGHISVPVSPVSSVLTQLLKTSDVEEKRYSTTAFTKHPN